jgi:magnesium-transporting ATPase (P-type)
MVFSGTLVAKGKGVGVVTSTGMKTQMGIISKNLSEA